MSGAEDGPERGQPALEETLEWLRRVLEDAEGPRDLPEHLSSRAMVSDLFQGLWAVRTLAQELSSGNLRTEVRGHGFVLGALKNLQSALRHLTWQTRRIADGDLHQQVRFLGEFSDSFNRMVGQLRSFQQLLRDQATRDALTGLYNRRFLEEVLPREMALASRSGKPLAFLMLDVDHFKQVNDRWGHDAGDAVLVSLAGYLADNVREGDLCFRLGGEEFLVLLAGQSAEDAEKVANRLREGFESLAVRTPQGGTLHVTFSGGIALLPTHGSTAEEVLHRADEALYQAKSLGRNRIVVVA